VWCRIFYFTHLSINSFTFLHFMLVTLAATSTNALMDSNKHRRQFVNITATIIRTFHLVCQNIFTCLLNALTNLKTIHFKNLWSFFIMLICRDYRNQIFALFSHFALRMVSRWHRNVVIIPLLVKEFLRIYSLHNPFFKQGSFFYYSDSKNNVLRKAASYSMF